MSEQHPVGRAIKVVVYAPLGAGLAVLDAAPGFLDSCAERGRAEVERRHEQVTEQVRQARGMGRFALAYGVPKLRTRARRRVRKTRATAEGLLHATGLVGRPSAAPRPTPTRRDPIAPTTPVATPEPTAPAAATTSTVNGSATASPLSVDLPIPGYDALSASQVVERLAGLGTDELGAVRAYETSHRNRRTILGKIDQLASPSA